MANFIKASIILSCIAALFLGCSENPTETESTTGDETEKSRIAGKVLQTQSSAKVYIEQGRVIDSAEIDPADGYFELSDLGPGTYRLRIAAQGYDTFSVYISVEQGYSYEFGNVLLAEKKENFDDTIPSVYDHYPRDKSEVIYLPPDQYNKGSERLFVSVSFDRPMDRASVEAALTIEPPLDGGYFVWYQNTKQYNYVDQYSTYVWDGMYMSAPGAAMEANMADTSRSYVPSAEITTYSIAKSFTYYFPKSGCLTDTTYNITIAQTAVDTGGTPLDSLLEFSFNTVQSAVSYNDVEMLPHNGDDWVDLISPGGIKLTFPRRMDEASVEANISVNLVANPIFLWQDFNEVNIYTGGQFVPETTYIITIDSSATDLGGTPIGETKVLSFKTAPIRIDNTTPKRGSYGIQTDTDIMLDFNTYMDRASFAGLISLVSQNGDTVQGHVTYRPTGVRYGDTLGYYLDRIVFVPHQDLANNTLHTFYVKAGAKDLLGYAMKQDYKIEFITVP
jgi:hypothetical protein